MTFDSEFTLEAEAEWPAHTTEVRPWKSTTRGSREDRTLTEVTVSLPPQIAELDYHAPHDVANLLDLASREIYAVDSDARSHIRALGGLLLRTESVASSKIERVEATIDDYARAVAGIKSNESATSMVAATRALARMIGNAGDHGDIRTSDLLDAHLTLMADDPYGGPYAGKFRTMQNWIGGSDYSPIGAIHVPPPPDLVNSYMADLMVFANRGDIHPVVQAAIAHAQFESIHPFTDGNGRIGRALINAIFRRRGVTQNTVVPVASAMLAERDAYFAFVNGYRDGHATAFVRNLASCAVIASRASRIAADNISGLEDEWAEISRPRKGSAAAKILALLTENPIMNADDAERLTGAPTSSVYAAMERLEADGIIHQVTQRKRDRVWGATAVLGELDALDRRIAEEIRRASRSEAEVRPRTATTTTGVEVGRRHDADDGKARDRPVPDAL